MKTKLDNKYTDYAEKIINGEIVACEYIKLACKRYVSWFEREDLEFRADRADDVVNFCEKLKHFKGRFNNKNFILEAYQKWICYNIFGFYYKGTEEQWNAITKGSSWNANMGSNVTGGTVIHYNS